VVGGLGGLGGFGRHTGVGRGFFAGFGSKGDHSYFLNPSGMIAVSEFWLLQPSGCSPIRPATIARHSSRSASSGASKSSSRQLWTEKNV